MESVPSESLSAGAATSFPQAAAEASIETPLSPAVYSPPVKEDPSSFDDDEKHAAEKQNVASPVGSDSDSFHSGRGDDDDFESVPERHSAVDRDEVTLLAPPAVPELETQNPVTEASGEGEGDEPAAYAEGSGFSGVARVPPSLAGGSGTDDSGNRSVAEKHEIGDSDVEEKGPSLEGSFSVGASETEERVLEEDTVAENPKVRVLGRGEEDPYPVAVEQSAEDSSEVNKEDILPESDVIDENVSSVVKELPAVATGELQSIESKDVVAEEKGRVDWKWWDLVVGTSSETRAAGMVRENGVPELQVADSEAEEIAVFGHGSDQPSAGIESGDLNSVGAVASTTVKIDSVGSGENPVVDSNAAVQTSELDSHGKEGFEDSEANPNKLAPAVAADGDKSILDNGQAFPDDRLESESGETANERGISGGSRVASYAIVTDSRFSDTEISLDNLSAESVSVLDVILSCDDSQAKEEEAKRGVAEDEGLASEERTQGPTTVASKTAERIIREMEHGSSSSQSAFESSREYLQKIEGQIMTDSDEEVDTDEEGEGKEVFDSAALAALLKAASNAGPDGSVTISAPDAARFFSTERPAGLGSTVPSLKPAPPRTNRPNIFSPSELAVVGEADNSMDEEEKKLQEKIQGIRVKFLRLVQRLGHSPEDTVAAQVLYRLGLAEGIRRGRQTNRAFSLESARKTAMQMETAGTDDIEFSCNILVLGKTGVGKSATVNSIFGEEKTPINAFKPSTTVVRQIVGVVDGVKIQVIDTPGLRSSVMDQNLNRKVLFSIKKFIKKCPPDIVLYIDRLDAQTRDFNDLPLLRSISSTLGPSIWLNAIVALTHAASAPPDGPNGSPLSYEVFIAQRSHIVQHSIRQAAGDMRLMNPVALVENHPSCRRNREGHRVLPNGQIWRSQLLLLCYSSKILSEANSLLKLQDSSAGKLFGFRVRSPPLPYLLSSLLQSRVHPKLSTDMGGENVDSDIDLDDLSDSDQEEEDEYDELPPFKPLKKSQIDKLSKEQRKAYFEEYDYRVKLLQKKQWTEELRRLRESKKRGKGGQDDLGYGDMGSEDFDQENGSPAAVPVPLPDMVLPPSFDGDNPAYRYRFLEPTSQLLVRPVLDTHGWDHDCGYDGVSLEENLAIVNRFPAAVSVQITKDKKEFNIHLDSSISAKHGEHGSTLAGFDIQSVGRQLAYILRGETKFQSFKKNKTTAGATLTFLGENVATGLKVEDQISLGKRVSLVASTGAIRSQGDMAYGANLEARLRDKEYPIGQDQSTLGLSLVKWRGDLALGANLQSQFSVGRSSKMAVRIGLNNKLSGQITIRTSSSEQLQIALVGIIPVARAIYRTFCQGESNVSH